MSRSHQAKSSYESTVVFSNGDEQDREMPFSWSPPDEIKRTPEPRSPAELPSTQTPMPTPISNLARLYLATPEPPSNPPPSTHVTPARQIARERSSEPSPPFEPLRKAIHALLRSERDTKAPDHPEACGIVEALRLCVLRLGEALRAEGIRFDPREIKDLGADPHLHEELASYMKQLGDVRRSLKTGAQNVLEGADLVNYTLVELDTALDGLEVTLPTSTGATSSGGFTGAGALDTIPDRPDVYKFCGVLVGALPYDLNDTFDRVSSTIDDLLHSENLRKLDVDDDSDKLMANIDRAEKDLDTLFFRTRSIQKVLSSQEANRPTRSARLRSLAANHAVAHLRTCLGELNAKAITHRELISLIRPISSAVASQGHALGLSTTATCGETSGPRTGSRPSRSASDAAGLHVADDQVKIASQRGNLVDAQKHANELRQALDKILSRDKERRDRRATLNAERSPQVPKVPGNSLYSSHNAPPEQADGTTTVQLGPNLLSPDVSGTSHSQDPMPSPSPQAARDETVIVDHVVRAYQEIVREVRPSRSLDDFAIDLDDDTPDIEADTHVLHAMITRLLKTYKRKCDAQDFHPGLPDPIGIPSRGRSRELPSLGKHGDRLEHSPPTDEDSSSPSSSPLSRHSRNPRPMPVNDYSST